MSEDLKPIVPEEESVKEQSTTIEQSINAETENVKPAEEPVAEPASEPVEAAAEEVAEEAEPEAAEAEEEIDFSDKSLKDLVDAFKDLIEESDGRKLSKYGEVIKACFYKTLKKERLAMGFQEPADKTVVLENTTEVSEEASPAAEDAPAAETAEAAETASTNPFAEIERGFKELYGKYRAFRAEQQKDQLQKREENYAAKADILQQLKELVENPGDLSEAYPKFRELQNNWRTVGPVPPAKAKDLYDSYHHNVEVFYDFVKINNELREMDFKKNLEAKEELCKKAEALAESDNSVASFRALQKLHDEWKELGPVAKEKREEIWARFKESTAVINKKYQAFFEQQKQKQIANLEAKTILCEKAEAIANQELKADSPWAELSQQIQDLQKEWRTIGFAVKKENDKIYERFRAACDKFFTTKKQFHTDFKDQMAQNLAKKEELCAQAEAVMNSEDWKKTSDILINLQKQWKEIGPVAKKKSEQVWTRFRAACDTFFENKEKKQGGKNNEMLENLAAKKALIADIEAFQTGDKEVDAEALKSFQARWREIGFVPFKQKEKLQNAYTKALTDKFGAEALERGRRQGGDRQRGAAKPQTEKERLVAEYTKLEQDIVTWENNIGFFAKSKGAETLVSEFTAKIEKAKADLASLKEQIKTIETKEDAAE